MTYFKKPAEWPKTEAPPPCVMTGTPEQQVHDHAKQFIFNVYQAMDGGQHAQIPFNNESVVAFQKGAQDRYKGPTLLPRLQQMHKGQGRDLSGLAAQPFPNNSVMCLCTGDMMTQASAQQSQQVGTEIRFRFADFFLVVLGGAPTLSCAVFRELDEDCGTPPPGAVQDPAISKADQVGQQFAQFFYANLDDTSKRGALSALFKDVSYMTVGQDLFKAKFHIEHKLHFFPPLISPTARKIEGIDAMPSAAGGFFVYVHGIIHLAGEERQQRFIDVFHLMPEGSAFWVSNMISKVHGGVA